MKKQILFLFWLLVLIPFNLIGQESPKKTVKLKPEQMTGWKAKGFNGNVRTITSANGYSITFNQLGNIVSEKDNDSYANTYSYTSQYKYMINDHGPYIITFADNQRIETCADKLDFPTKYTFDSQRRVIEYKYLLWPGMSTQTYIYTISGNLPKQMKTYNYDEYGEYRTTDTYEYINIDTYENWTKRKVTSTTKSSEYVENGNNKITTQTKTFFETRTITYYLDTNTSLSAQPAPQQNKAPSFPGGERAMVKFFDVNANPRKPAIATAGYGEVIVEFTVTEEGTIEDAKWKGRVSVSMDQEALRLVNMMPKWNPGFVDGQPSKMKVQVGLRFFPNQAFRYIKAILY